MIWIEHGKGRCQECGTVGKVSQLYDPHMLVDRRTLFLRVMCRPCFNAIERLAYSVRTPFNCPFIRGLQCRQR